MGHRRYVAFVAPRQVDPDDDRRLQAQVDVVRRWWTGSSSAHVLTPQWEPGTTTRHALAGLADQLTQVQAGATVAVYLTGHGDEGAVSTEYRLRVDGGTYDPATLLEAIWDSDADDALVVLDSCYAYRFAQRAANLYGDRVRQPGRTPPRMVLVVPGAATDLRVEPRFEELTDLLAQALRLVGLDDGHVEPYTAEAHERYLTPARLRAALDAAPGELARAGRPGLIRPQVQAFAAQWGEACPALPNPVYDPAAQVADPATGDLTMSAATIDEYWPPGVRDVRRLVRGDLPVVACGSFVVTGQGIGLDQPLIDPRQLAPAATEHWVAKATGAPAGDPAWYFTGRVPVMTQVVQWLAGITSEPLLVVTGARGTGKSAVLGRAVTLADPRFRARYATLAQAVPPPLTPPTGSVHVAVDARGRDPERVAGLILAALGVEPVERRRAQPQAPGCRADDEPAQSLHERLAQGLRTASTQRLDGAPVCVVVDSVDESAQPQALIHDVIAALVRTRHDDGRPAARALVGVRHDTADDTDLLGLVESLVEPVVGHRTVRTDDDASDEVRAYCLRLLARPGSPYRDRPAEAAAVADRLAHADQPSFLDARIVAESLSATATTTPVADLDVGGILPQALRRALADQARVTGRPAATYLAALRALAFARGAGTPWGAVWPALTSAVADTDLGNDVLRELLRGPLAAFTMTSSEDGQRVFRPAHATVTDVLRTQPGTLVDALADDPATEPAPVVEARIARRLGALARASTDDAPDPYLRRHLVAHAAAGGVLTDDVVPVGFLPWETSRDLRRWLGLPLPDGPTTRGLAAWAAVEPHLDQIPTLDRRRQALRFALLPAADQAPSGSGTDAPVRSQDGRPDSAVSGADSADAGGTGERSGALAPLSALDRPGGTGVPSQPGGRDVALGWRTWSAPRNVLTATTGPVAALAFGQVGGRALLAGASGPQVRCWDPSTGQVVGEPLRGHDGPVLAVAFGQAAGRTLLATGGADGTARIWDPATGAELAVLQGHAGAVWAVTVGQVGGRLVLATGSADQTAQLWDLTLDVTLRSTHQPLPHRGPVRAVAFGTVGHETLLATGCADGTARLWDPVTSQRVDRPLRHGTRVLAVAFGPVGPSGSAPLATSGDDGAVLVWDPATGTVVGRADHRGLVETVAFGQVAGRTLLATGGFDRTARLWDASDLVRSPSDGQAPDPVVLPAVGQPLRGHGRSVQALTFGQVAGRVVLATGSDDRTLRLWDPVRELTRGGPDGPVSPVGVPADTRPGEPAQPVEGPVARPTAEGRSGPTTRPHGVPVASPGRHSRPSVPSAEAVRPSQADGRPVADVDTPPRGGRRTDPTPARGVRADDATPPRGVPEPAAPWWERSTEMPTDSSTVIADHVAQDGDEADQQRPEQRSVLAEPAPPPAAPTSTRGQPQPSDSDEAPGPDTVVHTVAFGTLSVGALSVGAAQRGDDPPHRVGSVVLAAGGADHTVRLWDPVTGRPVGRRLHGHDGAVVAAAFGQLGGRTLLATADDATVRLWDPATGESVGRPLAAPVLALAFGSVQPGSVQPGLVQPGLVQPGSVESGSVEPGLAAGRTVLATGGPDRTVRLWDPATGAPVGEPWLGHQGWVSTVAFGQVAGQTVLATGSFDCTVRLWDADGRPRAQLTGHDGPVESAVFGTVDGAPVLATGADDATVRLWDPATGEMVGVLTGHGGAVQSVAFGTVAGTPVLATAADDRTVRLWDPATGRRLGDPVPVLVRVHDLAFAPDGRLALATDAGTAVLTSDLLVPTAAL